MGNGRYTDGRHRYDCGSEPGITYGPEPGAGVFKGTPDEYEFLLQVQADR